MADTNWEELTIACRQAMKLAAEKPGRYGGRYVGRRFNRELRVTEFVVLDDDDPELYRDDADLDILAQVNPTRVLPMGYARNYLQEDGAVVFPDERST